jgi:hypothetical protein
MELCEVTDLDLFEKYYEEKGLGTLDKRIAHLKDAMGVTAVCCEYGSTDADALMLLEDSVVVDRWRWRR